MLVLALSGVTLTVSGAFASGHAPAPVAASDQALVPAGMHPHPQVVQPEAGVATDAVATGAAADSASSPGTSADGASDIGGQVADTPAAQGDAGDGGDHTSDADLQRLYSTAALPATSGAPRTTRTAGGAIGADGTLTLSGNVPAAVADVVQGGNAIATLPYLWGGGHGSWISPGGYDCSGSVSYALAAAGLLQSPMVSGDFENWGEPGPGRWITIYGSPVHVWMIVAGHRFDTGNLGTTGTRWTDAPRSTAGFVVVHPTGF